MADQEFYATVETSLATGAPVKLVIWDLDETFWRGTLSEGGIAPIPENIELVKALSARGIVSSICSKNDITPVMWELMRLGVWDHFIFPRIAFAPKGAMIRDIIETAQLRAPNVLFVDDNVMNLNEALHYNPGLQIAEPGLLAGLLDDPRCLGKPDPQLERLARYKVLEQKQSDQQKTGGDNLSFLKSSGVRISFHHDVLAQFPRIHDLVNRTNQLNFTKQRWPEDEEAARARFKAEFEEQFNSNAGYVKVADRYGNYGICGYYHIRHRQALHFLFSCRAMNMGIEQFVWNKLGRPEVNIVGEVSGKLGAVPDWIVVVDDVDVSRRKAGHAPRPTLCVRGACDMMMMTHYLRSTFDVNEEFQFPYENWGIHPVARLHRARRRRADPGDAGAGWKTPGIPPNYSNSRSSPACRHATSSPPRRNSFRAMYRSRSTGLDLPADLHHVSAADFSNTGYHELIDPHQGKPLMTKEQWVFIRREFEYLGHLDAKG